MSEEQTRDLPNDDLRQILAQLAAINTRLDSMDERLGRLEASTKPLWENAIKDIADTRAEMREGFESVRAEFRAEMGKLRGEVEAGARKVAKQIDILNHNVLEVQAELRLIDDRLGKLEPQPTE